MCDGDWHRADLSKLSSSVLGFYGPIPRGAVAEPCRRDDGRKELIREVQVTPSGCRLTGNGLAEREAVGGAVFVLVVLGGLAAVTARAQHQSRVQLEQRFVLKNTLGASFAASYVRSVVAAERGRAKDALSGRTVTRASSHVPSTPWGSRPPCC